ncbi:MAG: O-antigen ligase family protein [Armatimonadetes bacterium]|nr:O-antigen ligase family protein [Armatimonadota bacterium]
MTSADRLVAPQWLRFAAAVLLAGSVSQLAYALHPRKGPFVGYVEVVAVGLVLVWAVWRARVGLRRLPWPPWPAWAFVLVAALSISHAQDLRAGLIEIVQYAFYFVPLYMLFVDAFSSRPGHVWGALTVGLGIAALVALAQMLSKVPPMDVKGLAANRNVYSALAAMLVPLAWAGMYRPGQGALLWRVVTAGVVVVALCTMVGPPHVWIALVALGTIAWVLDGRSLLRLCGPVFAVTIAVNLLSPIHRACNLDELLNPWETGDVYKLLRESGAGENLRLVKKRWLEWYPALAMLADNPLLGVGVGNYQTNIGRPEYWAYIPNAKKTEPDTNNLYLVIGGSMGFAGLAALIALLSYFAQRSAAGEPRWLAVGVAGAICSLAAVNVFTALLVRGVAVAWAGLFACATIVARGQGGETE